MRRLTIIFLVVMLAGIVGPIFRQVQRRFLGVNAGVYLGTRCMEYYFAPEVRLILREIARDINQEVANAGIDKVTGGVIPETTGIILDIEHTCELLMSAPAQAHVLPVLIEIIPPIRTDHLEVLQTIVGDFSTPVMGSPGRVTNMRLSLAAINNTLLLPGEIFSFNGVVGERTPEKGYRPAPIIFGELVAPGVGGGICQVSSTLYNAVRRAELEIVERRIHSIAPSYIQHGMDATVAWPHTDFKFCNDSEYPVIVKGEIQGWRVRVWIVGRNEE